MTEINTLLMGLQPFLSTCHFRHRQLSLISEALMMMQGRITMLSISRWTGRGGSYRTIERFFNTPLNWKQLNWQLIRRFALTKPGVILIAGDATTVTKSGNTTFGLGRFFSSLYSRTVPGMSFQVLSLIDVDRAFSWPVLVEQVMPRPRTTQQASTSRPIRNTSPKPRGRPKGAKNKNRRDVELNAEMTQVQALLMQLLALISDTLKPVYFVYDGAFGNNAAVQMTRQTGLHLISKLRNNSALYFQWQGAYAGKGRKRRYGERVHYDQIPDQYLQLETTKKGIRTRIYQFIAVHKTFADPLNAVVILKFNARSGKTARIILFSTDTALTAENLVKYYRLRFQIEFNFRDAKQHWGLEDFMTTKARTVSNAANLSLFMVNLSHALMVGTGETSVLDLKARYHRLRYAHEAFKVLPQTADVIKFEDWVKQIPVLGRIHGRQMAA